MEKLYFIRIGGTAMGGVAAACQQQGAQISGSETDLYEPMKSYLADHGVQVFPSFDPQNIVASSAERIVVGNAVSRGNEELEYALEQKIPLVSLPGLISEKLIDRNTSVVIAGTHGKTTTTSMVAWMLDQAGLEPGYLIGGVPGNFSDSCRPVAPRFHNTDQGYFISEGDEYDTAFFDKRSKFLLYRPDIGVINNIEFDHADIFDSLDAIKRSFRLFARLVPRNGVLLANHDDPNVAEVIADPVCPVQTFGFGEEAYWRASDVRMDDGLCVFDLHRDGSLLGSVNLNMPGDHNVSNMLVACAVGLRAGLSFEQIVAGALSYKAPKRRLEEIGSFQGALVVDDFAHHPTAIQATLDALGAKYPGRRIWVAFEPRSNTTTRNIFQHELANCFSGASGVMFGATDRPRRYTSEEKLDLNALVADLGVKGIDSDFITEDQAKDKDWGKVAFDWLETRVEEGDIVGVFSNGNFGGLRAMLVG